MKNIIPVIVAVVLAIGAVFAVSRMKGVQQGNVDNVSVVIAARDLGAGEVVKEGYIAERLVPRNALPAQAILWEKANLVVGQEVLRSVARGDYVMLNDVGMNKSLSRIVANGEWAVPVTFADYSLLQFMQPGDEIAIWATYSVKKAVANSDLSKAPAIVEEKATSVLFPCVRILDIGSGDGVQREEGIRNKTVIVALPPQQAGILIAAQREAELFPALRRPNDITAKNRLDAGKVTDETLAEARNGLSVVKLPNVAETSRK